MGKSRNIIISSHAESVVEFRSPFDAANLGFLFGLNEHQGKLAVGNMPREVIRAAQGRKLGPYRALVRNVEDLGEEEKWKIPDQENHEDSEEEEMEVQK